MTVIVRLLHAADAAAFQALRLQGLLESPFAFAASPEQESDLSLEQVAERLVANPDRRVCGAFDGQRLVGTAGVLRERHLKLAHKAVLWGVYVAPGERQAGVGKALLDAVVEAAFSLQNIRQINLSVNTSNGPAIRLYEAIGFRTFGIEPAYMRVHGHFHDALHMVCTVETWVR